MSEESMVGEKDSTSGVIEIFVIVNFDDEMCGENGVFASSGKDKLIKESV